jgi:hypothetical protein
MLTKSLERSHRMDHKHTDMSPWTKVIRLKAEMIGVLCCSIKSKDFFFEQLSDHQFLKQDSVALWVQNHREPLKQ